MNKIKIKADHMGLVVAAADLTNIIYYKTLKENMSLTHGI
jgi:hypothetical protein